MKTPHKHAELIKAWADGATIELREGTTGKWRLMSSQGTWYDELEYRIKPEPKPDVVRYAYVDRTATAYPVANFRGLGCDIGLKFDGETGRVKEVWIL